MVKGVLTGDDARHAIDEGAAAVSVSNHGGRQLDGVPASLRALPEVVEAVKGRIEVLMDGGIRRGTDIVKAIAWERAPCFAAALTRTAWPPRERLEWTARSKFCGLIWSGLCGCWVARRSRNWIGLM